LESQIKASQFVGHTSILESVAMKKVSPLLYNALVPSVFHVPIEQTKKAETFMARSYM